MHRSYAAGRSTEVVQVNPYTASFAAFLVGLFTDKAYGALSRLADGVIKRLGKHPEEKDEERTAKGGKVEDASEGG